MEARLYLKILLITGLFLSQVHLVNAQFDLNKIKKKTEKKIEKKVDKKVDETIDKVLDGSGNETEKIEKQSNSTNESTEKSEKNNSEQQSKPNQEQSQNNLVWNKYDFIPGDVIIFDDELKGEKNGEFPSKWDLTKGNIEIANLNGENVITFLKCNTNGGGGIIPLLKNSNEDYLPDEFTIEFDAFFESNTAHYGLYLLDYKNQKKLEKSLQWDDKLIKIAQNSIGGKFIETGRYPGTSGLDTKPINAWRHIAVSFNQRALKMYLDDSRVVNVPNLGYNPTGMTLGYHNPSGNSKGYVKNIRIAKGAVPLYDKFMTDGKIVTTGIKFDVNKSTIKSESMGVINDIYKILTEHTDINFSIEGHTDSDGDDKANLKLSEERANAVKNQLISMGISSERLKAKGLGESKPIDSNDTPEGKSNNRRVEFIKF